MTAIHPPLTDRPLEDAAHHPLVVLLRRIMIADAVATAVSGLAVLVASASLADAAGLATTGPLLAIGGFFVALAMVVATLGRLSTPVLLRLVPVNAAGDLTWAGTSVAVALMTDLSRTGQALVLLQAVAVLAVGGIKLLVSRRGRAQVVGAV
jgi:hypothetical protein